MDFEESSAKMQSDAFRPTFRLLVLHRSRNLKMRPVCSFMTPSWSHDDVIRMQLEPIQSTKSFGVLSRLCVSTCRSFASSSHAAGSCKPICKLRWRATSLPKQTP